MSVFNSYSNLSQPDREDAVKKLFILFDSDSGSTTEQTPVQAVSFPTEHNNSRHAETNERRQSNTAAQSTIPARTSPPSHTNPHAGVSSKYGMDAPISVLNKNVVVRRSGSATG